MSSSLIVNNLKQEIENFYLKVLEGKLDYLPNLAAELQLLADRVWDEVEELYPYSVRIDP